MRDMNDLKNAFGKADDGFEQNVYRTLANLEEREETTPMKKASLRLIVTVAAVFCVLTTTVFAMSNAWGVMDFLNGRIAGVEVPPDAAEIVQTNLPQEGGEAEAAVLSIREAVYDGRNIYIVVTAKPTDPSYLLLGAAMPSDPVGNLGPQFQNEVGTIAEYAKKNGKTPLRVDVSLQSMNHTNDSILEADGTLAYMMNGDYISDETQLPLTVDYSIAPFDKNGLVNMEEVQKNTLTATLQSSGTQGTVASTSTAEYTDCGVRVDKVTLTGSPMSIYAEIEYTVIDKEKFAATDDGLWFEFIDENGDRLPDGAAGGDSIKPIDESRERFIQTWSLRAAETLPSEITLRGYNCWDKNRYEAHSFAME
ncbi:MAG: hypothetical protein LBU77_00225 [Clostridiales bacterium]|jgi:hypothetical protein|nr:hypothetical protein [Clostridiales bacterium]